LVLDNLGQLRGSPVGRRSFFGMGGIIIKEGEFLGV
jgi:hypothetical protein